MQDGGRPRNTVQKPEPPCQEAPWSPAHQLGASDVGMAFGLQIFFYMSLMKKHKQSSVTLVDFMFMTAQDPFQTTAQCFVRVLILFFPRFHCVNLWEQFSQYDLLATL